MLLLAILKVQRIEYIHKNNENYYTNNNDYGDEHCGCSGDGYGSVAVLIYYCCSCWWLC